MCREAGEALCSHGDVGAAFQTPAVEGAALSLASLFPCDPQWRRLQPARCRLVSGCFHRPQGLTRSWSPGTQTDQQGTQARAAPSAHPSRPPP